MFSKLYTVCFDGKSFFKILGKSLLKKLITIQGINFCNRDLNQKHYLKIFNSYTSVLFCFHINFTSYF